MYSILNKRKYLIALSLLVLIAILFSLKLQGWKIFISSSKQGAFISENITELQKWCRNKPDGFLYRESVAIDNVPDLIEIAKPEYLIKYDGIVEMKFSITDSSPYTATALLGVDNGKIDSRIKKVKASSSFYSWRITDSFYLLIPR